MASREQREAAIRDATERVRTGNAFVRRGGQSEPPMTPPIVPTAQVDDDAHQVALWRLAAVAQYLYHTMNGDADSDRDRPDPMPALAMEKVREAQLAIDEAIKVGQRTRRSCIGGELDLCERWKVD